MPLPVRVLAALLLAGGWLIGCTQYEYDVVRPPELAQHVGAKEDVVIQLDPLEYRLRTVENRLVMRIYNHTDDAMTLVGQRSSVVDPDGQSHPLPTLSMPPGSFIKLILPPPAPVIETNPTFGIGVSGGFGDSRRRGYPYDPEYGLADGPRYFTVYDNGQFYWDWKGEGSIRLNLAFDRGGKTFEHEFVIGRRKV
ncbi:MAG TPA: hypothetical protein VH518_00870 [Tepidisphaeraceae bacterium]